MSVAELTERTGIPAKKIRALVKKWEKQWPEIGRYRARLDAVLRW
jgi:hypothetical protein